MNIKLNLITSTCLILIIWICILIAGIPNKLEKRLHTDIDDYRLNDFSHIEAVFILSGISDSDSLNKYLNWYSKLIETIRDFHFDSFDRVGSANKVFAYLHATWLIHYEKKSTTLLDIVRKKHYNCVSGTILYNLLCEDLGWATEAFETPSHVYTIFSNFTERVMVENTSPMGFNIMKNLREYSRYLVQFYPRNQVLKIGLDRLYAYENSKGRVIDNTELLGLLAYNRAYFKKEEQKYEEAYDLVLLAQKFNRDSRSNVNFEIDLYYKWGKKLFNERKYNEAFQVYADSYYRYPYIKDFSQNTKAAFFNAIQKNWRAKDWLKSRRVIEDIYELELLEESDKERIKQFLQKWAFYFFQINKKNNTIEVIEYYESLFPDNMDLTGLKKSLENIN